MIWSLLLACQAPDPPPAATTPPPTASEPVDTGDATDVITIPGPYEDYWSFSTRIGMQFASGFDLDHDGIHEWATLSGIWNTYDYGWLHEPTLAIYEGGELVAEVVPHPQEADSFAYTMTAGDIDQDSFPDLVFTATASIEALTSDAVDREAIWAPTSVGAVAFAHSEHGAELISHSVLGMRRAILDSDGAAIEEEDVWVAWSHPSEPYSAGEVTAVDSDGDGLADHVFAGTHARDRGADGTYRGRAAVCPLEAAPACTWMADGAELLDIGDHVAAGDLDGDGIPELLSTTEARNLDDDAGWGSLTVFDFQGQVVATVGNYTFDRSFGRELVFTVDDHDEPWALVVTDTAVYGFRGATLFGDLTLSDADRTWHMALGVTAVAPYRAAPDDPLQLLLGNGISVAIVPFDQ